MTWLLLLIGAAALSTCRPAAIEAPEPVILSAAGSDALLPLMRRLADAFTADTPHITFEFEVANSTQALARLAAGEIDLALSTLPQPDLDQFAPTPIARDGLAIIVHPDNPVDNLTLRDLTRLYSGRIFNWRDVQGSPGPNMALQVVTREGGSGTRALFQARILPDQRMTPNARILPHSQAIVDFIAQHPEAIGYVSQAHVSDRVKVVAVEELLPAPDTLANAAYPLTYLLYVVAPAEPDQLMRDFVAFILGPAGQSMIASQGFGRLY